MIYANVAVYQLNVISVVPYLILCKWKLDREGQLIRNSFFFNCVVWNLASVLTKIHLNSKLKWQYFAYITILTPYRWAKKKRSLFYLLVFINLSFLSSALKATKKVKMWAWFVKYKLSEFVCRLFVKLWIKCQNLCY